VSQITSTDVSRPIVVTGAAWAVLLLALSSALLSISLLGVEIPLVSGLGPGGDRVVLPAGIVFAIATAVFAVIGVGLLRMRAWAWAAGVAVTALALLGGVGQFRGAGSVIGLVLALIGLVLLLTPGARAALRR
jgi:hypothetical protein